jgi:hypothetical protein
MRAFYSTYSLLVIFISLISISNSTIYNGSASCYGDYQNILRGGSIVQSGIGNYIAGMLTSHV